MVDEATRKTLGSIPLLRTKAGPRDKELWVPRLKEEYQALIKVRWGVIGRWSEQDSDLYIRYILTYIFPRCSQALFLLTSLEGRMNSWEDCR